MTKPTIHDMLKGNWQHIDHAAFDAEMTRLGYDKLLLDNALLGEIVHTLITRHNEVLAEYDTRWLDDLRASWDRSYEAISEGACDG